MRPQILFVALSIALASASWNALAEEGHDHGDEGAAPAAGNGPRRLPDGSVFLPKPAQRQIGVRTLVTEAGELPRTVALAGKVVIDTCNPIPSRDGEIATWAREKGAGLASAELLPGARIVRAFNAIGAARMGTAHERKNERVGMPIAGDDARAIELASRLIRDVGYEPVLIGGLAMGKYLMPGTPLAGEHPPDQVRQIAATLK